MKEFRLNGNQKRKLDKLPISRFGMPASIKTKEWSVIFESLRFMRVNIFIVISINQNIFPLLF